MNKACGDAFLVHLIWMVLEIGGRWPDSCHFMGCCCPDLFNIARRILVQFPSSFFSICFVSIHVMHLYSRIDATAVWKKLCFILLDNLSIAVYAFARHILMSLSVDEMLPPKYVNLSNNYQEPPFKVEMSLFCLHSHGGHYLLLPALDYAIGIQLG